jgi:hypothetical protein
MSDAVEIRNLLDIPDYAPDFTGYITRYPDRLFKDCYCDDCDESAAVHIAFTVDDRDEGLIATDATFCADCASEGIRFVLDRDDRSIDHDTDVSINYWAIRYGLFADDPAPLPQAAA